MKNLIIIALIAYGAYYFIYKKKSQCETMDDVKNKGLELAQAFIHAATDRNSDIDTKSLITEINKIEIMKKNGFPNIQQACEAMDDIMDELD